MAATGPCLDAAYTATYITKEPHFRVHFGKITFGQENTDKYAVM